MIPSLLNEKISLYRRVSTGRDSLNNPIYGTPTSGVGWILVYANMPCRLAFVDEKIEFAAEAERVLPHGTMYFSTEFVVKQEDRVRTPDNIEYVVTSIRTAYKTGSVIDHYEAILELP